MGAYRESHGRTFHNTDADYNLPNDAKEYSRLNIQHQALKLSAGTNCPVPIQELGGPKNILDLCCGSGQWVIEMAEEYPGAEVVGVDISVPTFSAPVPANCKFIHGDITKPLPFPAESFDLVQMRLATSIWNRKFVVREIGRVLRKGGYISFVEPDELYSKREAVAIPAIHEMHRLISLLPHHRNNTNPDEELDIPAKKGWSNAPYLKDWISLSTDGDGHKIFGSIDSKLVEVPVGLWPTDAHLKQAGELAVENWIGVGDGFRPSFLEHNVMTAEGFDTLSKARNEELNNAELRIVAPFWFVWGKKNL